VNTKEVNDGSAGEGEPKKGEVEGRALGNAALDTLGRSSGGKF